MELTTAPHVAQGRPRLPARLKQPALGVLNDETALLHELSAAIGGPYHLLFPERFDDAATAFTTVLGDADVAGRVYFAKKANKAACWVRRCAELGIGVDVASLGELRGALAHGVRGDALVVTGPAKREELHRLAILHGSLLVVDALDELERVVARRRGPGRSANPAAVPTPTGNAKSLRTGPRRAAARAGALRTGRHGSIGGLQLPPRRL